MTGKGSLSSDFRTAFTMMWKLQCVPFCLLAYFP